MRNFKILNKQESFLKIYKDDPLFRAIFDDSPDAIFLLNSADFTIIDCNKKALSLFQAQHKNDLISFEVFSLYDVKPVEFSKNQFIETINKGQEYSHELAFKTIRGNVFWGRINVKPIETESGKIIVFRARRVVDYLKTAEMMSTLVKHTSKVSGLEYFSAITGLLSKAFDARFCLVARLDEPGSMKASTLHCWANGTNRENFSFSLEGSSSLNVLKGYTTFYPRNLKEMFPDDELVTILGADSFMGAPIFNDEGEVTGMIILMDDHPMEEIPNSRYVLSLLASRAGTELSRIDSVDHMQQKIDELIEADHRKDRFLQLITHDLKNPFSNIMGFSDILREKIQELDKGKITQLVNAIDASVRNSYGLLENLSDWSKMQRSKIKPVITKFDLYEAVKDAHDLYYHVAENKDIQLITYVYPETFIRADRNMMHSVLQNLISNALKYTAAGGQVVIDAMVLEDKIDITVQDTGVGIPQQDIEILLKEEINISRMGTGNEPGTGLGLSLCRDMIKMNHGSLAIESREGQGTTVTITLPGCPADE
ncbi:MAG: PAS domain-containing sensor histidine kinase [Bacteroidales bacterium]|nr:PAS domain-containing sensor histidine kinase [Bacteroidales bacterium]